MRRHRGKILELNDWQEKFEKNFQEHMWAMKHRMSELENEVANLSNTCNMLDSLWMECDTKVDQILEKFSKREFSESLADDVHDRLNENEEMWKEIEGMVSDLQEMIKKGGPR